MANFETQLIALIDSAKEICDVAEKSGRSDQFNGSEWTPAIILGHLVDVDKEVWMARFELMREAQVSGAPNPRLQWWEPDAVVTAEKYSTQSFAEARTQLLASRENMVSYLKNLSIQERAAAAQHRTFGAITIESMLQVLLDHDKEHQASIS
ncbi:MAG: DinB family protein [Actinobacteria bacterium]|nr:DinB family protein [Actinomycetota bacterium]